MKALLIAMVALFLLQTRSKAESYTPFLDWDALEAHEITSLRKQIAEQGVLKDFEDVKNAKYFLLNGNKEHAKILLERMQTDNTALNTIKKRLLAMIFFLEEDYTRSLRILNQSEFSNDRNYAKVCMLKVMNLLLLDDAKNLYLEFSRCSNLTSFYSPDEHLWPEALLSIKTNEGVRRSIQYFTSKAYFKGYTQTLERAIIWLKLVIFLNKEHEAYPLLNRLPQSYYRSDRFKEALAFIYYRLGNFSIAEKLVANFDGPNAENIRGNIRLSENKYELAYGHFQLALQKKNNSLNALERLLPLSWLLQKWNDGLRFIEYLSNDIKNVKNKKIIQTVFLTRKKDYDKAAEKIESLFPNPPLGEPLKINQLIAYLALHSKDNDRAKIASIHACRQYDGLNCWILFQLNNWQDFSSVLDDKTKIQDILPLTMDDLKKSVKLEGIQEPIYINQEDIEELDEKLLKINLE